jgi:hypothetical protein
MSVGVRSLVGIGRYVACKDKEHTALCVGLRDVRRSVQAEKIANWLAHIGGHAGLLYGREVCVEHS